MSNLNLAGFVSDTLGNASRLTPLHSIASVSFVSWLLWRFWRFTIYPILNPDDPKELPYWIPFIGHGFSFFRSTDALLSYASRRLGTREPFSITVFGNTLYIVTEPQGTVEVYKNQDTLSFDMFIQQLFRSNGYSESALRATYTRLPTDKAGFSNPHGVSFGSYVQQMHIHQLYPGSNLGSLEENLANRFSRALDVSSLSQAAAKHGKVRLDGSLELLLGQWCSEIVVHVGELAYFGEWLSKINPDLSDNFLAFDELGWQVLYQYPALLSCKMSRMRGVIQGTIREYLKVPQGERKMGGAIWLITALEDEARALGIGNDDVAVMLFNIYWVIGTNTRKLAFWLLSNLLHTAPGLLDVLREETAPAFEQGDLIKPRLLWEGCPQLENVWLESLRLCSNAASVRHVDQDTVVGGRLMRKGNRIMIPYRLLHFDPDVYGQDSRRFRPDRFAASREAGQGNALMRGSSWRPFGGGKTLCTGRHAAKRAILIFVATLLRRYHIKMVGNPPPPEPDLGRPVLGISSWKDGHDFTVRLWPREVQ